MNKNHRWPKNEQNHKSVTHEDWTLWRTTPVWRRNSSADETWKRQQKQKNQHHHQHHHHHRHHLNHFALCVYATNVRVCNNSYILRNTHADFINGKKLRVLFLFFFREKTTFSRHQCRLHEVNCMRENRVTSKSMYHRCCCYIIISTWDQL